MSTERYGGPVKVYHTGPRTRQIVLLAWLLILLVPLASAVSGALHGDSNLMATGVALAAVVWAVVLPIFWVGAWRYPRLVLSAEGVALEQLGMTLKTPWDNVASLRTAGRLGLVLREPMPDRGSATQAAFSGMAIGGAPVYDEVTQRLMAERRYIPLDNLGYWMEHGDLAGELARLAPQLAAGLAGYQVRPAAARRRPFLADASGNAIPARRLALPAAVVVLALCAGLAYSMAGTALQARLGALLALVVAGVLAVYAGINARSAARDARQHRFLPALLWGALAVVTALAAVGVLAAGLAP